MRAVTCCQRESQWDSMGTVTTLPIPGLNSLSHHEVWLSNSRKVAFLVSTSFTLDQSRMLSSQGFWYVCCEDKTCRGLSCRSLVYYSAYNGPFLLKLPYYHQNMTLVLDIFCFYKFYIFLHDNGQVYLS